jgi:hypothetical protein
MNYLIPAAVSAALCIFWGFVVSLAPNLLNVALVSVQFTEGYIYHYLCSKGKIT